MRTPHVSRTFFAAMSMIVASASLGDAAEKDVVAGKSEATQTSAAPKPTADPISLPPIVKVWGPTFEVADEDDRPTVAGDLRMHLRSRHAKVPGGAEWDVRERTVDWKASETAIIICDMWDDHYCVSSAQRVGVMAPKMNRVITEARAAGVLIVHAPSGVTGAYADSWQRKRILQTPKVAPPVPIESWCHLDPKREPPMPVETEKCACDDPTPRAQVRFFSRQHPALDIMGYDVISDRGDEIYSYFHNLGIKNVALMGVHTNMCVLGRPFGIRQQVRLGVNTVLVRDLTDTMYDPRQPPYVSHARGTELVVEHIEKYWCPSILSDDLTAVVAGTAGE